MLVWDALGQRLNIVQLFDQQGNLPLAQIPIVLLDMWEHAFYLQYRTSRPTTSSLVERRRTGRMPRPDSPPPRPRRRPDRAGLRSSPLPGSFRVN